MCMDKDDFALLKVIAASVETIKDDIKEMKASLESKVNVKDFEELKNRVRATEEKSEKLHNKWWFASGIASALSYIFSHLLK